MWEKKKIDEPVSEEEMQEWLEYFDGNDPTRWEMQKLFGCLSLRLLRTLHDVRAELKERKLLDSK